MIISVEISYYPLTENFNSGISRFLEILQMNNNLKIEPGKMSSLITGEYHEVMNTLTESMETIMKISASVFNIKLSNSCPV